MTITQRITYGAAGLAVAAMLFAAVPVQAASLTDAQITSVLSLLTSFDVDSSTIATVSAVLHGTTPSGEGHSGNTGSDWSNATSTSPGNSGSAPGHSILCPQIRFNLSRGDSDESTGGDVSDLQNFLKDSGFFTASSTGFFGSLTQDALHRFQENNGISGDDGMHFGPMSREALGKHCGQLGSAEDTTTSSSTESSATSTDNSNSGSEH